MMRTVSRLGVTLMAVALNIAAFSLAQASSPQPGQPEDAAQAADLVVVMKSERELYLYRDGLILAQYPIALGLAPIGTKRMRGDDKTPIGAYTLDWRNPNSDFHRSIHISYPDAEDQSRAAELGVSAGNNIMIHGQPDYDDRPRSGDWTHGCIAVSNTAIDQIWARVPDGTPIHIYP
ncbi:L,D-transpeptidase family protein [Salinisphaera sp. SPP-AMP-43]|uniref:L,D-transpeptidase family protein n=1 Tax=Salinisphaera sp. SPP-AMP-43 TaxID=3121288 RepID=UPI003C6E1BD0